MLSAKHKQVNASTNEKCVVRVADCVFKRWRSCLTGNCGFVFGGWCGSGRHGSCESGVAATALPPQPKAASGGAQLTQNGGDWAGYAGLAQGKAPSSQARKLQRISKSQACIGKGTRGGGSHLPGLHRAKAVRGEKGGMLKIYRKATFKVVSARLCFCHNNLRRFYGECQALTSFDPALTAFDPGCPFGQEKALSRLQAGAPQLLPCLPFWAGASLRGFVGVRMGAGGRVRIAVVSVLSVFVSVLSVFSGSFYKAPRTVDGYWPGLSEASPNCSVSLGGCCCGSQTALRGREAAAQLFTGQRIGDNKSMKTRYYRLNRRGKVFCVSYDFSHGTSQNSRI